MYLATRICIITWSVVLFVLLIVLSITFSLVVLDSNKNFNKVGVWFPFYEGHDLKNTNILHLRTFRFEERLKHTDPYNVEHKTSMRSEIVPPARKGSCCATSRGDDVTFCFGGIGEIVTKVDSRITNTSALNDFWMWKEHRWFYLQGLYEASSVNLFDNKDSPSARAYSSCWILSGKKQFFLLGGEDHNGVILNDFWTIQINDNSIKRIEDLDNLRQIPEKWTRLSDFDIPLSKATHWKSSFNHLWLFGGTTAGGAVVNAIWKYVGTNWETILPVTPCIGFTDNEQPYPNCKVKPLVWIDQSSNFFMYGGLERHFNGMMETDDFWKWEDNSWHKLKNKTFSCYSNVLFRLSDYERGNENPSCRANSVTWIDQKGDYWFWGGYSRDQLKADIWSYSNKKGTWTWEGGHFFSDFPAYVNYEKLYLNTPPPLIDTSYWVADDILHMAFGEDNRENIYSMIWSYKFK